MLFSFLYLGSLLAPGLLITQLLKLDKQRLLLSISFSLVYFLFVLLVSVLFSPGINFFYILYLCGLAVLCLCCMYRKTPAFALDLPRAWGSFAVLGLGTLYLAYAGFYDELPSDIYVHLEFFKQVSNQLATGQFKAASGADLLSRSNYYWYHLPTLICHITQTEFLQHLAIYSAINMLILLLCIYEFFTLVVQ